MLARLNRSYKLDAGLVDSDEKMFFSFYLIICSPLLNYEYYSLYRYRCIELLERKT